MRGEGERERERERERGGEGERKKEGGRERERVCKVKWNERMRSKSEMQNAFGNSYSNSNNGLIFHA